MIAGFAVLSTCCLLCQMDEILTDLLAAGASHPLKLAIHRLLPALIQAALCKSYHYHIISSLLWNHLLRWTAWNRGISTHSWPVDTSLFMQLCS